MRYFRHKNWENGICQSYNSILKTIREDNWEYRKNYSSYQDYLDNCVKIILDDFYEEVPKNLIEGWNPYKYCFEYIVTKDNI